MKIVILLFDHHTTLDIIGPCEVLARIPGARILLTGIEKALYSDIFGVTLRADFSIEEINNADVLLIPGGPGVDNLLTNDRLINWISEINKTTAWTTSVCSGSLLLAASGVLENRKCTTHWKRKQQLSQYNVTIVDERYVSDGKFISAAGVSAGIDMAIYLAAKLANENVAKKIQLGIEYDPSPPYDFSSLAM